MCSNLHKPPALTGPANLLSANGCPVVVVIFIPSAITSVTFHHKHPSLRTSTASEQAQAFNIDGSPNPHFVTGDAIPIAKVKSRNSVLRLLIAYTDHMRIIHLSDLRR